MGKGLAQLLSEDVNKKFKEKFAYAGGELAPTDVTEWVSTGSSMLDLAISNRPHGGFPVGRLSEIVGWEASGKSLLAAHAIVSTQKKGGIGIYFDTEYATSKEFFTAIGVDYENFVFIPLSNLEKVFTILDYQIERIRAADKDQIVTIVIDSIMGAKTESERAGDYEKKGWNTEKAIILSQAMRKITDVIATERICMVVTNQLREKMGVIFGDSSTTSGGKAIAFHSSVRIRLTPKSKITIKGKDEILGRKTVAEVFKNRLGPPLRKATYDIYFNSGIDDWGSWLDVMKANDLVEQKGAWYTYNDIKFQSKDFYNLILSDDKMREEIYDKICDAVIMEYKVNESFGIDDVERDNEDFGSEEISNE